MRHTLGHLQRVVARLRTLAGMAFFRYMAIAGLASAEVLMVFFLQDDFGSVLDRHYLHTYMYDVSKRQFFAGLLPVPAAFLLWLRLLEQDGRFRLRFSPVMAVVSIGCCLAIPRLILHAYLMRLAFALGVLAALFLFIPFIPWLKRAAQRRRIACIALIAGSAAWAYYFLMQHFTSHIMLAWTAQAVSGLLGVAGIDIFVTENMEYPFAFSIYSNYFMILLAPFCGGLEGIFLFMFMFSVMLLADWERFQGARLWLIYGLGAIGMFAVNAVRIVAFFLVGYLAFKPGEPAWVQALQGAPLYLFHSYVGWVLYLLAFGLFAAWFYRSSPGTRSPTSGA